MTLYLSACLFPNEKVPPRILQLKLPRAICVDLPLIDYCNGEPTSQTEGTSLALYDFCWIFLCLTSNLVSILMLETITGANAGFNEIPLLTQRCSESSPTFAYSFLLEEIWLRGLRQDCLLCRDGPCSVTTSRQNRHDDGKTS